MGYGVEVGRDGTIQAGIGTGLGVELVRTSIEYENDAGIKPNLQSQLLAAEVNVAFWRDLAGEELTPAQVELVQKLAVSTAKRMRESMERLGMLDTMH